MVEIISKFKEQGKSSYIYTYTYTNTNTHSADTDPSEKTHMEGAAVSRDHPTYDRTEQLHQVNMIAKQTPKH